MILQFIAHTVWLYTPQILAILSYVALIFLAYFVGRIQGWFRYLRRIEERMPLATREAIRTRDTRIDDLIVENTTLHDEIEPLRVAARGSFALLANALNVTSHVEGDSVVRQFHVTKKGSSR